MYQNFYPYDYRNDLYDFRSFKGMVGQVYNLPVPITNTTTGQAIPPGTDVFIHRVDYNQAGQELVTIVIPTRLNGMCTVRFGRLPASELTEGGRF